MTNILVIDTKSQSSALIKSVLLGGGYSVSGSDDLNEAIRKIKTDLFDMVCIDMDSEQKAAKSFLVDTREFIPNIPVIAISENGKGILGSLPIFRIIKRPISVLKILDTVRQGIQYLEENARTGKTTHRELKIPVELSIGKTLLRCKTAILGLNAALIEPDITGEPETNDFQSFFFKKAEKIITSIMAPENSAIKLLSRIVFTNKRPDERLQNVGLSFVQVKSAEQEALKSLLTHAA